ncbi:Uncharacterized iron-regulated membrane protein [Pseudarcicella hirudinis]|uniref:Uncharacterized iron-regulated membrane protein n=2 Tax=Pseudarcicella hirudinis TaxID=1079859 RepID=A0A1I5YXN0_9BACT|nr:PepSY-associated TM helix domain-containing protein [Pseudarcicella hirudinis]SFQ48989.1 Uncharacterized iron-regulated membrane protein [Pseudarcicella hirudinis]
MSFKKITGKLHLWLGLSSGLVVFIVALTGCLYAFQAEIQDLVQPYKFVNAQNRPFLPPSTFQKIAEKELPGKKAHSIQYEGKMKSVQVAFYNNEPEYYYVVFLDPYSGKVLKTKDMNADFFRFVLMGHYYLWLPPAIGQPVVATGTLIFVILLISGIILWWPKNKSAAKQRFSIKWSAQWRRKNYDLHNVLGFYMTWIVIFIALTGLVWGFQWFSRAVYWTTSGGKEMIQFSEPLSDSTKTTHIAGITPADKIWAQLMKDLPEGNSWEVHVPESPGSAISVNINPAPGTYWKTDYRYFDQHDLAEISVKHPYGKFKDAKVADKIMRMNYDLHVGAIFGLPGKILAFFASLIATSLPVTGVIIWLGRKKKDTKIKKKEVKQEKQNSI